jgi:transposase
MNPGVSLAGWTLEELRNKAVEDTFEACGRNKSRTARMLGITEKTVYNYLRRLRGKPEQQAERKAPPVNPNQQQFPFEREEERKSSVESAEQLIERYVTPEYLKQVLEKIEPPHTLSKTVQVVSVFRDLIRQECPWFSFLSEEWGKVAIAVCDLYRSRVLSVD